MARKALTAFAAEFPANRPGLTAWIESIAEWPEVLAGWQAGVTKGQIRQWLIDECGYDATIVTPARLDHLSKNHARIRRA